MMAKQKSLKQRRIEAKLAKGRTRLAAETTSPGTKATPQARQRRPQQKIKLVKGAGTPTGAPSIAKRHQQFLRQQREGKVKVRSLVGRDVARGRQASTRVTFKRGAKVATTRLKQFAEFGVLDVIREVKVTSSWVDTIHLVMLRDGPALAITFRKSGFTALYPTTNIRDYEAMSRAASKGKFIWAALYHGRPGQGVAYQQITF